MWAGYQLVQNRLSVALPYRLLGSDEILHEVQKHIKRSQRYFILHKLLKNILTIFLSQNLSVKGLWTLRRALLFYYHLWVIKISWNHLQPTIPISTRAQKTRLGLNTHESKNRGHHHNWYYLKNKKNSMPKLVKKTFYCVIFVVCN